MWQRTLQKVSRIQPKQIGWSRYVFLRRFSSEKPENQEVVEEKTAETKITELLDDAANFNELQDPSWSTSPYPQTAAIPGQEERVKQDPREVSVLLFPGQGTVKVGQINDYMKFPRVKEIFDVASEVLSYNVLKMLQQGPQEKLNRTEFNQAATLAMSLAAMERLWEERPMAVEQCKAVAGYSVGELAALVFAGAISMEDGLRLAAVRGAAMQTASDKAPQGMLSVYCKPVCKIAESCEQAKRYAMDFGVSEPVCGIAIYLHSQTKILAGHEEALQFIEKSYHNLGFRHLRRLPVSGAFHTDLMKPAVPAFKKALEKVDIGPPRVKVFCNVTGKPYRDAQEIRKQLLKHLYRPVKWEQILHVLYSRPQEVDFPKTFDMGSGGIMKGIMVKVNSQAAKTCFIV